MEVLAWVTENAQIVLTVLGFVGIYLKMKRDEQQARIEMQTKRDEDDRKRRKDLALAESKRVAHKQDMEAKQAEDTRAIREFFQDALTHQTDQIKALEASRDDLQNKVTELTTAGAKKDGVIDSLNEKIASLKTDIQSLREDIESYQIKNTKLATENHKLSQDVLSTQERNTRLRTLNDSYAKQIADLQTQLEALKKEYGDKLDTIAMQLRMAESTIEAQAETIKRLTKHEDTAPLPVLDDDGEIVNNDKKENV
jgi:chromosome segregation ATPase